jgi:endoglucanase
LRTVVTSDVGNMAQSLDAGYQSTPSPSDQLWGVNITFGEGYVDGDKLLNSSEALDAGHWDYMYPTIPEIDYFASKGETVLRIPFVARRLLGDHADIDIGILRGIIDHARSLGMTVLLDSHGAGPSDMMAKTGSGLVIGSSDQANQEFAHEWSVLATIFKDQPNVIFGLTNEPHDVSASQFLVAANMAIQAIRATGATQTIDVPGSYWTTGSTWTSTDNATVMLGVEDPLNNYYYEVHQYLDEWNSGEGPTVPGKGATALVDITNWARANNKQLFLGEYAFGADPTSMKEGSDLQNFIANNPDVWRGATYWAAGAAWGPSDSVEPTGLPDFWLTDAAYDPTTVVDKPQMSVLTEHVHQPLLWQSAPDPVFGLTAQTALLHNYLASTLVNSPLSAHDSLCNEHKGQTFIESPFVTQSRSMLPNSPPGS